MTKTLKVFKSNVCPECKNKAEIVLARATYPDFEEKFIAGYLCESGHSKEINEERIIFWKMKDE